MTGIDLSPDELLALRAYADRRRARLTADRLGAARKRLAAAGLVRNCTHRESPMFVAATGAGLTVLAAYAEPMQLELFVVGAAS